VDFDATDGTRGQRSLDEMVDGLYTEMLAVAAGKPTKSEVLRHCEA
jgi:altronate dehydratase